MQEWQTEKWLYHTEGDVKTGKVAINQTIFSGDSLSPLLFCLALVLQTNMLTKQGEGYEVMGKNKFKHLFYIDDLKLFSWDEIQLQQELTIVKSSGYGRVMEFVWDKCVTAGFKHGKLTKSQNITLNNQTVIRNRSLTRCTSTEQGEGAENNQMRDRLAKKYYNWVWQILTTELNSKNKNTAIKTSAVPVLVCSFRIVNWFRKWIVETEKQEASEFWRDPPPTGKCYQILHQTKWWMWISWTLHIMLLLPVSASTLR